MKYYRIKCKKCDSLIVNTQDSEVNNYIGSVIGSLPTKKANSIQVKELPNSYCMNFLSNRLTETSPTKGAKSINILVKCNQCDHIIGERQSSSILLWKTKIGCYSTRFKCNLIKKIPPNKFNANMMLEMSQKLIELMDEFVVNKCTSCMVFHTPFSLPETGDKTEGTTNFS